jgi:hypothetical protein
VERFAWTCEDEDEALGFATVLRRAGVEVWTEQEDGAPPIVRAGDPEAARALASRMLSHYARADSRERRAALDRRDRRGLVLLAVGLAALAVAAVVLT